MSFGQKPRPRYNPDELPEKRKPKSIKKYMLWLLSRRDYSEAELREKLLSKEFTEDEVAEAVALAQKHGFQSDARYAETKTRATAGRQGNYRVKRNLLDKGISEEIADAQMETLAPEEERAIDTARRFVGKPLDDKLKQKAYRFLASRGFSGKAIKAAMAHLRDTAGSNADDEGGEIVYEDD